MDYPFTLPGYESHQFFVRVAGILGGMRIFADGKPAKRNWSKYHATLSNGEEVVLTFKFTIDFLNPKIVFKDHIISVFPQLSTR